MKRFAVLPWHPDPRYTAAEAVRLYNRESDADRCAAIANLPGARKDFPPTERGYVVRPVEVA